MGDLLGSCELGESSSIVRDIPSSCLLKRAKVGAPGYTGKKLGMQESYRKGIGCHPDPRSCGGRREVTIEAWIGASAGREIEPRKAANRGADAARLRRKATRGRAPARVLYRPRVV